MDVVIIFSTSDRRVLFVVTMEEAPKTWKLIYNVECRGKRNGKENSSIPAHQYPDKN